MFFVVLVLFGLSLRCNLDFVDRETAREMDPDRVASLRIKPTFKTIDLLDASQTI
jgi:hypothetical protein